MFKTLIYDFDLLFLILIFDSDDVVQIVNIKIDDCKLIASIIKISFLLQFQMQGIKGRFYFNYSRFFSCVKFS